jgi:hypothetical protein
MVLWGSSAEEVDANELMRRSRREPIVELAMGCSFKMQDCTVLTLCVLHPARVVHPSYLCFCIL